MRTKQDWAVPWWNPAVPNAPSTWLFFLCPRTHTSPKTCYHFVSSVLDVRISRHVIAVFVFRKQKEERRKKSINTHNRLRYFLTNKIFLLQVMYRYATYDFHCKMRNSNTFFHRLHSALMEKHYFYCSLIPQNCTWYCTVKVLYFFIPLSSLEEWGKTSESLTFIRTREKAHGKCTM